MTPTAKKKRKKWIAPREQRYKPMVVYSIRVDKADIVQARRMRINLGAVIRTYIKAVVWKHATVETIRKEQEKWTIVPKT